MKQGKAMGKNISRKINEILNEAKSISTSYPNKAYEMSREALYLSQKNNLKPEEGYALIGMALACRAKSENNKMLDNAYNALEIFEELHVPYGQVKALNLIGIAYFYNAMYDEALQYFLQALDMSEELRDDFLLSSVLNNVGEVFRESGKYDNAMEYFTRAHKISTGINSNLNTASLLNNIGEIYFMNNKYDEALEYFTESYNIIKEEKEMIILGEVENKLGKVYYVRQDYHKAAEYFFSSLKTLETVDNKFYAIDTLVNIAKLQLQNESGNPLYYFEKALYYAEKTKAKKKLSEVYKILANHYEEKSNFKTSLEYYKKYHGIEQEIAASITESKLEILKIELNHIKVNHEFEKVKIINKRLEMEISNQRKQLEKMQRLNKDLEKKALVDELTGIPNRSYINYHLDKAWQEALLHDNVIALYFIDIDNFKKYNDYWGHLKGDECLIKIANCIKCIQSNREDIFGRYGGEEFIYCTKDINYEQALELGNLIKNEVEGLCMKYTADRNGGVVTISVGGVLGRPSDISNIYDMVKAADMELYKAKNAGRNKILMNNLI